MGRARRNCVGRRFLNWAVVAARDWEPSGVASLAIMPGEKRKKAVAERTNSASVVGCPERASEWHQLMKENRLWTIKETKGRREENMPSVSDRNGVVRRKRSRAGAS